MSTSRLRPLALLTAIVPMVLAFSASDALGAAPARDAAGTATTSLASGSPNSRKTAKTRARAKRISKRAHTRPATKNVASLPAPEPLPAPTPDASALTPDASLHEAPSTAAPATSTRGVATTTTTTSATIATGPARSSEADAPAPTRVAVVAPTGGVVDIGLGIVAPATPFLRNDDVLGPGLGADVRGGYYFARHVGIVVGLRVSFAHKLEGCVGCKTVGYQVPLMVQIAASRMRGIYGEAGVGFFTGYASSKDDVLIRVSTPAVLKLGAGYRIGLPGTSSLERKTSADIHVGVDLGQMTSVAMDVGKEKSKVSSSASIENPTLHVVAGISIIGRFAL